MISGIKNKNPLIQNIYDDPVSSNAALPRCAVLYCFGMMSPLYTCVLRITSKGLLWCWQSCCHWSHRHSYPPGNSRGDTERRLSIVSDNFGHFQELFPRIYIYVSGWRVGRFLNVFFGGTFWSSSSLAVKVWTFQIQFTIREIIEKRCSVGHLGFLQTCDGIRPFCTDDEDTEVPTIITTWAHPNQKRSVVITWWFLLSAKQSVAGPPVPGNALLFSFIYGPLSFQAHACIFQVYAQTTHAV